jgi:cytoskeletal protein RodZ
MLDLFSKELREAREAKNISLSEMASQTRIDIKFLEAIDKGNFSFLPEIYVRAFLRQYARTIGLNEDLTVKKYEAAKLGKSFEEVKEESPEVKKEAAKKPAPSVKRSFETYQAKPAENISEQKKSPMLLAAVLGAILIIFLIVYLVFLKKEGDTIIVEKPLEEILQENRQRYEETPAEIERDETAPAAHGDSLSLIIQTSDTSWVKIFYDDTKSEEFILFPNSQKRVSAKNNFKITFGNSRGIQLRLNEQPLNFSNRGMTVTHIMVNKDGLQYINQPQ